MTDVVTQPSVEIVTLTPSLAQAFLKTNTRNRRINQGRVVRYADAMTNGEWELTPDGGIGFDKEGVLIDGQHRCLAVVKSGVSVPVVVYNGLNVSAQDKTNTGQTRSLAGQLSLRGETNTAHLGAAIAAIHSWEHGLRGTALRGTSGAVAAGLQQSITELISFYESQHDLILSTSKIGKRIAEAVPIGGRVGSLTAWVLMQIDPEDGAAFISSLISGADLSEDDPIFVLRHKLIDLRAHNSSAHSLLADVSLALIFKAWNAWRDGDTIQRLQYKVGGARREQFPEPH